MNIEKLNKTVQEDYQSVTVRRKYPGIERIIEGKKEIAEKE